MKKSLYIIAFAFLFTACERIVEVDIPSDAPRLVIESEITNIKDLWKVKLTLSQPYFYQDSALNVSSASVYIHEIGGDTVQLNYTDTGLYVSADSQKCTVGNTYVLHVTYKGKVYEASEELKQGFPLDTVMSFYLPPNDRSFPAGNYVFLQGQTDPSAKNYYAFKTFRNDTFKGQELDDDQFGTVSLLNSSFNSKDILGEIARGALPRPILFNVEKGDTVRIEQQAITKMYYQFLFDINAQQSRSGSPFDSPPANPNNNISNGALGYFSVAHLERGMVVIP